MQCSHRLATRFAQDAPAALYPLPHDRAGCHEECGVRLRYVDTFVEDLHRGEHSVVTGTETVEDRPSV